MREGRKSAFRGRRGREEEALRRELEGSLEQTRLQLAQAYAGFNSVTDQELVESFIYEIQALQARYSYLLRQRKALDVQNVPAEGPQPSALPVV